MTKTDCVDTINHELGKFDQRIYDALKQSSFSDFSKFSERKKFILSSWSIFPDISSRLGRGMTMEEILTILNSKEMDLEKVIRKWLKEYNEYNFTIDCQEKRLNNSIQFKIESDNPPPKTLVIKRRNVGRNTLEIEHRRNSKEGRPPNLYYFIKKTEFDDEIVELLYDDLSYLDRFIKPYLSEANRKVRDQVKAYLSFYIEQYSKFSMMASNYHKGLHDIYKGLMKCQKAYTGYDEYTAFNNSLAMIREASFAYNKLSEKLKEPLDIDEKIGFLYDSDKGFSEGFKRCSESNCNEKAMIRTGRYAMYCFLPIVLHAEDIFP